MREKRAGRQGGAGPKRIPLVFGISGHRDPLSSDLPQLREQLSRIFTGFHAAYPHTPFQLLTPLAEGADRLAAEVALASKVSLLVPLPMKQKEYERDFTTAKSLAEFRALLGSAEAQWEILIPASNTGMDRTRHYAEVGDFIARRSHVLILLWDGGDNRKVGGTAWVKKRREHWVSEVSEQGLGLFPYGPTIQVVTPRASGRSPRPRPATIGQIPPSGAKFAVTLSKQLRSKVAVKGRERPPLHQLVYWAIDSFNSGIPGSVTARNSKRQSATRSRL